MKTFAIVTPSLNTSKYIGETIQSIVSQAGDFNIRFHVQDGGSTDNSLEIIRKWAALIQSNAIPLNCNHINFSFASAKDDGLYDAINHGFEHIDFAENDCMGWINADDILAPGALAMASQVFGNFKHIKWLSGRTAHIDELGLPIKRYELVPYTKYFLQAGLHDGRFFPLVSQEGTFWRGELWRKVGGLKTQYKLAADFYLWKDFAQYEELSVINAVTAYFRVHHKQKSSDISLYYKEIDEHQGEGGSISRVNAIRNASELKEHPQSGSSRGITWRFVAGKEHSSLFEFSNTTENSTRNGIFAALYNDQLDIIKQYFECGVSPNISDDEGIPFFVQAHVNGSMDVIRLCEYWGFDSESEMTALVKQKLCSALIQAINNHNTLLVEKLVKLKVPLNETIGNNPPPLFLAVYIDSKSILNLLIKSGADVDIINIQGSTPLLDAIYLNRIDQVKLLIEHGADISIKNKGGLDALSLANSMGHTQLSYLLSNTVIDVCICTHNPRMDIFRLAVSSLARQTADKSRFRVLIIDNASSVPICDDDLSELASNGINYKIVSEPRLGNVFARAKAIEASTSEWILFVDDDNELANDYIKVGFDVISKRPEFGCFGGRLHLGSNLTPPAWVIPLLPYLAVRDFGEEEITSIADYWGKWEPATAGGFVRRPVLDLYLDRIKNDDKVHQLGRKGKNSLNSGEDSLMMWGAAKLGLASSYQPRLGLAHHLNSNRFNLKYFFRLMLGYGKSNCILDKLYLRSNAPTPLRSIVAQFKNNVKQTSWQYALCLAAYHVGYNAELKK